MKGCVRIIDFYMNQLLTLEPSPYFRVLLEKLILELKYFNYPNIEFVDIISIWIILDFILSDDALIKSYRTYIKKALSVMNDILGDGLYVKIEPRIYSVEREFYTSIAPTQKQFDDRLAEEIRNLIK